MSKLGNCKWYNKKAIFTRPAGKPFNNFYLQNVLQIFFLKYDISMLTKIQIFIYISCDPYNWVKGTHLIDMPYNYLSSPLLDLFQLCYVICRKTIIEHLFGTCFYETLCKHWCIANTGVELRGMKMYIKCLYQCTLLFNH